MARIRFRVQLFKGAKSIDLGRLATIPEELDKFLRALGDDIGLEPHCNKWQASKFADGSLAMSAIPDADVSADIVTKSIAIVSSIISDEPSRALEIGASEGTLLRFSRFTGALREGETCRIGLYKSARARAPSKWLPINNETGREIDIAIHPIMQYEGGILGIMHSLFKEGGSPHFVIRDIARRSLVKCFYNEDDHYRQIVKALAVRDNRVFVSGRIKANRLDREIESIVVRRMDTAEKFSDEDFENFIGCAPNLTGNLLSSEYIDKIRDD